MWYTTEPRFKIGDTVKLLGSKDNYRIVFVRKRWFGTPVYNIRSIKATTADEIVLTDVYEGFIQIVNTVSPR